MNVENSHAKKNLRAELRARLQNISSIQREHFSRQAGALLARQKIWQTAKSILFYAPLPNEINLWPLLSETLAANKIVVLPRFHPEANSYVISQIKNMETDFLPGKFGIHEPKEDCASFPLNQLELALVPGVGFDKTGGRLGRGRGFYDRLLAQISGTKCGVAFDEQVIEKIPMEPHDVRLNFILTPTRWLQAPLSD
ncbi:MAG: 5-formyltetrahydrofolate cyclo-ligase [Verrucomicrobiota bacterium]|nr:5-formyltetrahydrofolate cyclo-ligase [Verrucomicrobiota bacterium]